VVGVFRTLEEAFAWLKIANPPAMPEIPKGARRGA
jgi:hypothetical protein